MSKASELIKKYNLRLERRNGEVGFRAPQKHTSNKKVLEELKANKEDIKAELLRQVEERKEKERKEKEEKEQKKQDIRNGKETIKLSWHDGEILSGYMAFGVEEELLEELGLTKNIMGWGTKVEKIGEELGEEFTYQQALDFVKPIQEEKEEKEKKKKEKEEKRQAKFDEAKETGIPVVLSETTDGCNDPNEDCDLDLVKTLAMPDGSTKEVREHTW